ncbi:CLUMA_CG018109, isoform A [Clunio marinus]|uniref:Glycosyltransferase family 92 protein n=1 Tax=Clunio marinus TaxID=568069 RepID=A0A1J1J168_9DIPT|nr:CLUMA_CG018109, isoform A [Clunio marinus]
MQIKRPTIRSYKKIIHSVSLVAICLVLFLKTRDAIFSDNLTEDNSHSKAKSSIECEIFPESLTIHYENDFWQHYMTSDGNIKLFKAYYDERSYTKYSPKIRIIAMINRIKPSMKIFCQLFYEGMKSPIVTDVKEYRMMWDSHWENNTIGYVPYLISCDNQIHYKVPVSVSLVENRCDNPNNNLDVINRKLSNEFKEPFAVCVKPLDFEEDNSSQLIEWIEILSILGASKIFVYVVQIHPAMMKVLKFYEKLDKVKIEMTGDPEGLPDKNTSLTQWLQNQMISINDCLYQHMNEFDFLTPLDLDEIIMPVRSNDYTWREMLIHINDDAAEQSIDLVEFPPTYLFDNVFFLTDNIRAHEIQHDVPQEFFFLQLVYRARNFSKFGHGTKSFHNTDEVIIIHNHLPISCVNEDFCKHFKVSVNDGRVQHYRTDCENYPKSECESFKNEVVKDLTLWKYKNQIIYRVKKIKEEIGYFE